MSLFYKFRDTGSPLLDNMAVSFADVAIVVFKCVGMLVVNITNSSGPNSLCCGSTPDSFGKRFIIVCTSSNLIMNCLSVRNDFKIFNTNVKDSV